MDEYLFRWQVWAVAMTEGEIVALAMNDDQPDNYPDPPEGYVAAGEWFPFGSVGDFIEQSRDEDGRPVRLMVVLWRRPTRKEGATSQTTMERIAAGLHGERFLGRITPLEAIAQGLGISPGEGEFMTYYDHGHEFRREVIRLLKKAAGEE